MGYRGITHLGDAERREAVGFPRRAGSTHATVRPAPRPCSLQSLKVGYDSLWAVHRSVGRVPACANRVLFGPGRDETHGNVGAFQQVFWYVTGKVAISFELAVEDVLQLRPLSEKASCDKENRWPWTSPISRGALSTLRLL